MFRCLYNALNDRIRNLLLQYDYSKSSDPLQPFAAHIASLLTRDHPKTTDIEVTAGDETFQLHKIILSARSPYFFQKLSASPSTSSWKLPNTIPPEAFNTGIRYLYLGEAPRELRSGPGTGFTESEVFAGIDKIAKQLELHSLIDTILEHGDRRLARQRRTEETAKGRDQMEEWFSTHILKNKTIVDTDQADEVKWYRDNGVFADVLLRADEEPSEDGNGDPDNHSRIPVGPRQSSPQKRKSTIFPAHKAIILRSEFFLAMFSSGFREAQNSEYLHIVPVDCSPEVLEIVLTFLYTEKADFPLDLAVDVLFAADLLLIERLKTKAAVVISTLGSGSTAAKPPIPQPAKAEATQATPAGKGEGEQREEREQEEEPVDIYDIIRAGWLTRVQRLEEFAARYLAYRLEAHIDSSDFEQLVLDSSARIQGRQETDSIELIDDIRYYLSERFRLRFEDAGLDEMMEEERQGSQDGGDEKEEGRGVDTNTGDGSAIPAGARSDSSLISTSPSVSPATASSSISPSRTPQTHHDNEATSDAKPDLAAAADTFNPVIRTLDGQVAGDEFSRDATNYQILLNKLDQLLEKLDLDA